MTAHYKTNVVGVVALFQAVKGLVVEGKGQFVTIGSSAGLIGDMEKRNVSSKLNKGVVWTGLMSVIVSKCGVWDDEGCVALYHQEDSS